MNVIIDSSVWIDHIRLPEPEMIYLLGGARVVQHPFVTIEVALGSLKNRVGITAMFSDLPQAVTATHRRLLEYIETAELHGTGIGFVDAHLLASADTADDIRIWTRDRRLAKQAERLGFAYQAN